MSRVVPVNTKSSAIGPRGLSELFQEIKVENNQPVSELKVEKWTSTIAQVWKVDILQNLPIVTENEIKMSLSLKEARERDACKSGRWVKYSQQFRCGWLADEEVHKSDL